jgi:iron complex outermembrane receptor protein
MTFVLKPAALAVALALPAASLYGATADAADDKTRLPAVTISGTLDGAAPLGAMTLDPALLAARRAATSDTARLLEVLPGVGAYGAGGVSSLPVIRGLADDRLRIQVDGMDLTSACANHMNPPLSYIDPSAVGRIEVFGGIVPVSAGGDSIGGAIRVESPEPRFAAAGQGWLATGEAGAFYRGNGRSWGGNVAATVAGEALSLTYRGATARAENYTAGGDFKPSGQAAAGRGWLAADEVGSTSFRSTNQSLALALRRDDHLAELRAGVQEIPYQGFPNQRMDMTGNDSTQVRLRYRGRFDWGALEARAFRETTEHRMDFGDDKLFWYGPANVPNSDGIAGPIGGGANGRAAGMPMDTEGENSGVAARADLALSERDLLRVGAEALRHRLDDRWPASGKGMWPNTLVHINDGERDRLAAFGEWEARWSGRWLTQVGVRYERVATDAGPVQGYSPAYSPADEKAFNAADRARTDHHLDLAAVARFTPSPTGTYEFGASQKSRSPNLYERYAWSTHGMSMRMVNWAGDGNGYVGNLDLGPETARTVSAAADWHDEGRGRWHLRVSPYFTTIDDAVDAARCFSATPYGNACTAANLTRTTGFVYLRFVNQTARLYGIDVSGQLLLARTDGAGTFTAGGTVSWLRGENRTTGDSLYNMMPLNARLALEHRRGGWSGTVEAQFVDAKDRVSQVRNEVPTAGYGLVHLRASYAWPKVRLDVGVENLFDRFYNAPLGGAYVGQGKTMSGTDVPWGVPVPGMGRSLYVAATVTL